MNPRRDCHIAKLFNSFAKLFLDRQDAKDGMRQGQLGVIGGRPSAREGCFLY